MRRAGQLSRWGVDATADPASMSDRQKHGFTTPSALSRSLGRRQSVCQSLRCGGAFDVNAATKKGRHCCRPFVVPDPETADSGHRLDARREAALVAGGFVLVDQATRCVTIQHRSSGLKGGGGGGLVVGINGFDDFLDRGAHHGTCAGVAGAANFRLFRALLCGLDIGQGELLEAAGFRGERRASMRFERLCVNRRML